ncbi:hypothetical protein OTU49_011886 [Cherax quadricarinatus]|uniref:C-type lectin domain-containing protein n=1 Tax=Cherax quadricarinatus TaxID=27406 RepID=A0AAW0YRA5_CHEQU
MILKVFLLLLGSAMVYGNAPSSETTEVSVTTGSCTLPYVKVGSRCLLFFVSESGPWSDMEFLCQSAGGHLAIVDDANLLGDIVDFIAANDLSPTLYWLGATDEAVEGNWKWVDGSSVKLGTPFWLPCTHEPNGGTLQNCLAITVSSSYYFTDDTCTKSMTPICE